MPEEIKPATNESKAVALHRSCSAFTFAVSPEQEQKIAEFTAQVDKERGRTYAGAIGGATTYEFTPTSIGLIFKVRHWDKELDLSDYEDW